MENNELPPDSPSYPSSQPVDDLFVQPDPISYHTESADSFSKPTHSGILNVLKLLSGGLIKTEMMAVWVALIIVIVFMVTITYQVHNYVSPPLAPPLATTHPIPNLR